MIVLWGAFWAAILFLLLKVCGALRMPEEVEILGLEYADLGWNGYKLKSDYSISASLPNPSGETEMKNTGNEKADK